MPESPPHSSSTTTLSPVEKLNNWTDTIRLSTPVRQNANIPYLYQFSLATLREGLIHLLHVHRRLEEEHNSLVFIREKQYASPRYARAFRFVDRLEAMGMPGLTANKELWMVQLCMKGSEGDIRMFRKGAKGEEMALTGRMFRHSIEVVTRVNEFMRVQIAALRWAVGVAQGGVEDARMVQWWAFERRRRHGGVR